ncbi:MAG: uroporphyrinogen-III synthase [Gemmataceae bacterium]
MSRALEGRTIALAEGRQLEELAQMLEKEGAGVVRCPMVSILDAPDPAPVVGWIREAIANRFNWVILYTGEGVRRLLSLAEREALRDDFITALGRTRTLTRGPKPVRALKEVNLAPTMIASNPTTEGLIASLRAENLRGMTIGVQLFAETHTALVPFLEHAGATVRTVLPYVYAPASAADRVGGLIQDMAMGRINLIVFTSSPQVERLYEIAKERGLEKLLEDGLRKVRVAAVGPLVADDLRRRGAPVDICPEQGFVMKNLVQHIVRSFSNASWKRC